MAGSAWGGAAAILEKAPGPATRPLFEGWELDGGGGALFACLFRGRSDNKRDARLLRSAADWWARSVLRLQLVCWCSAKCDIVTHLRPKVLTPLHTKVRNGESSKSWNLAAPLCAFWHHGQSCLISILPPLWKMSSLQ